MAGVATIGAVTGLLLAVVPHLDVIDNPFHRASHVGIEDATIRSTLTPIEFVADASGERRFSARTRAYDIQTEDGRIRIAWPAAAKTLAIRPVHSQRVHATGIRTDSIGDSFRRLHYADLYTGIDLDLYGNQGRLEYDFVVAAGADPNAIRLAFDGADAVFIDRDGALVVKSGIHAFLQPRPTVYQRVAGRKRQIEGGFVLHDDRTVGFRIGHYDPNLPLIIDPILEYGSYLGGAGTDQVQAITTDALGNVYVTGMTTGGGLPGATVTRCTSGGCVAGGTADNDAFVSKFSADGQLVFTTYLGGQGRESGQGIAVDDTGIYVSGWTSSPDFPVSNGSLLNLGTGTAPYDQGFRDAFVAKLSLTGDSISYATYLGGSADDAALALRIDSARRAYVAGFTTSADLPVAGTPYQDAAAGKEDAFLARFDASGLQDYGTYLGGQNDDVARDLAVDATGQITLTGFTGSGSYDNGAVPTATTPFPTTSGAFDPYCGIAETVSIAGTPTVVGRCNGKGTPTQDSSAYDAFVTRIDPNSTPASTQLLYSTFLGGGRYDYGNAVALDSAGDIVVGGETVASDFPVTMGPCTDADNDGRCDLRSADGFIAKIHPAGTGTSDLVFARYLAGDAEDTIQGLTLDSADRIYVTGSTTSRDFPVVNTIQAALPQRQDEAVLVLHRDAFVTQFSADGSQTDFSSYLGGRADDQGTAIALDANGVVRLGGYTVSANLPVSANAAQSTHGDLQIGDAVTADDGFVAGVGTQGGDLSVSLSHDAPDPLTLGQAVTYTAAVTNLGTDTVEGVMLTDVLSAQAVIFDAAQSDASCSQYSGTVQCTIGSIGAGQTKNIAIVVTPKNQGDYTNTVSTSGLLSEADSSNNEASAILHVAYVASSESGSAAMDPISLMLIISPAALMALRRSRLRDGDGGY